MRSLVDAGHDVTVLNRGSVKEEIPGVRAVIADRRDEARMAEVLGPLSFDWVYDQVCYTPAEATAACRLFGEKTGRYVFTSSKSVYGMGAGLKESDFDPFHHAFELTRELDYAEAKRQAEAVFFQTAPFPVTAVRFPIVLGEDDYTHRLDFHVGAVKRGEPIFFPSIQSRISFVDSSDAAAFLFRLLEHKHHGPINFTSPDQVSLRELMSWIEERTGKRAAYAEVATEKNDSPFGITADWFMNVDAAASMGLRARVLREWLPELITSRAKSL